MIEKNSTSEGNSEEDNSLPEFVFTEYAKELLKTIEDILSELVLQSDISPEDDEFYFNFRKVYDLYDRLQEEVIEGSEVNLVCKPGCSVCCCHWVEDVNSFEGAVISRYLSEHYPERINYAVKKFRQDIEALNSLVDTINDKTSGDLFESAAEDCRYDLLLSCFYQLERPCALLDKGGRCIIYPVRPFSCRDYINIRDSAACLPERINHEERATLIMHLSDSISEKIEILHRRFDGDAGDTSLRSLLVSFLD